MAPLLTAATALCLAALLAAEWKRWLPGRVLFKTLASSLFVAAACLNGGATSYHRAIVAGLSLSLVGDVLLIPEGKAFFLAGLAAFLAGHLCYSYAFIARLAADARLLYAAPPMLLGAGAVVALLWPRLGGMRLPVCAYAAAISVMAWSAWSMALQNAHPAGLGLRAAAGATLFFLSDLSVAYDRFGAKSLANKLWGLPLYYAGQLLIAFSA